MFLGTLLTSAADGKPDNYMVSDQDVSCERTAAAKPNGKKHIVGIDNGIFDRNLRFFAFFDTMTIWHSSIRL